MKPVYKFKLLALSVCSALAAPPCAAAPPASCHGDWQHPVEQHVEMRGMSMSMEEFANDERHFSIKQSGHVLDIYFLKEALLIKGPPMREIERYSEEELSWFPMVLEIPNSVLSSLAPKGPCALKGKTQFSQRLDGNLGFGPHKLTFIEGNIAPSGPSELAYTFAATVTPPLEGVASIQYSGSIRFARRAKPLAPSTNVTGYTLIGPERPMPVVGDANLHLSTVAELRTMLAQREPMDEDSGAEPHF